MVMSVRKCNRNAGTIQIGTIFAKLGGDLYHVDNDSIILLPRRDDLPRSTVPVPPAAETPDECCRQASPFSVSVLTKAAASAFLSCAAPEIANLCDNIITVYLYSKYYLYLIAPVQLTGSLGALHEFANPDIRRQAKQS